MRYRHCAFSLSILAISVIAAATVLAQPQGHPPRDTSKEAGRKVPAVINPPPTPKDWADLAKLPDWSGVWNPKITDQDAQVKTNPPPWNEKAASLIRHQLAEEKAGRPPPLFVNCLPEAMPAWMLVTHN